MIVAASEIDNALRTLKDLIGLPPWLIGTLTVLLALRALYSPLAQAMYPPYKFFMAHILPLIYTSERRARVRDRQMFADHIEAEIRRYNAKEDWADHRFAELEAEVEVEDSKPRFMGLTRLFPSTDLRRERSLTRALTRSADRQILLVGDPGSGKSVALRHLGYHMARAARQSRRLKAPIPLYINLKELSRDSKAVDPDSIKAFILSNINRANDRDIAHYLGTNFDQGVKDGTWVFLLDSFDEIPQLLSSTEMDETVQHYADAIYGFLHGMKKSRGIIASREYRSPKTFGRARFRILPLTDRRKKELLSRARLPRPVKRNLLAGLHIADPALRQLSDSPLFLSLLCDYMRDGATFPENSHAVFEAYIDKRFVRDSELLAERYPIHPDRIREIAEELAYCMVADQALGLNPSRHELEGSMTRLGLSVGPQVRLAIDALLFIKLARSEEVRGEQSPSFTFAHRRFQEYFATCFAIAHPDKITLPELLKDGRWRETAVTICQTQVEFDLIPLACEAENILDDALMALKVTSNEIPAPSLASPRSDLGVPAEEEGPPFSWPSGVLHLLSVIDAGLAGDVNRLPRSLSETAGAVLFRAANQGRPHDCKWAIEVAGAAPKELFLWLIRSAFRSQRGLLREAAYRQIGRLADVPNDLASDIRRTLLSMSVGGQLRAESLSTSAQLRRVGGSRKFLTTKALVLSIPWIDFAIHTALLSVILIVGSVPFWDGFIYAIFALSSIAFTYALRASPPVAWPHSSFRAANLVGLRSVSGHVAFARTLSFLFGGVRFFMLLVGLAGLANSISPFRWPGTLVAAAIMYVALWSPCALAATRSGILIQPWWWPLIPVALPVYLLVRVALWMLSGRGPRWFGRIASDATVGVVALLLLFCVLSVCYYVVGYMVHVVGGVFSGPSGWIATHSQGASFGVSVGLGTVFAGTALLRLIRLMRPRVWLRKWSKALPDPVDGRRLLTWIASLETEAQLLRLMQIMRRQRAIGPGNDALQVIGDLFLATEHTLRLKKQREAEAARRGLWRDLFLLREEVRDAWHERKRRKDRLRRSWPEFTTPYFLEWLEEYVEGHRDKMLRFRLDVSDEMSRIVEDTEGFPTQSLVHVE